MSQSTPRKRRRVDLTTNTSTSRSSEVIDLTDESLISWERPKPGTPAIDLDELESRTSVARFTKREPENLDLIPEVQNANLAATSQYIGTKDKSDFGRSSALVNDSKQVAEHAAGTISKSEGDLSSKVKGEVNLDSLVAQIGDRVRAHLQTLPPSRKVLRHARDYFDPEAPTLKFSFNAFVAKLDFLSIKSFLEHVSAPGELYDKSFFAQIFSLYGASKKVGVLKLVEQERIRFFQWVDTQVDKIRAKDIQTAGTPGADTIAKHNEPILRHFSALRGLVEPYMRSRTYAGAVAFSNYSPFQKHKCLTMYHDAQIQLGLIPPPNAPLQPAVIDPFERMPIPRSSSAFDPFGRPPFSQSILANEGDFEKFLDEIKDDQSSKDEGANTAQEVIDAAASINAIRLPDGRYAYPGMSCSLHPHQVIGVHWMSKRERQKEEDGSRSKVRGGLMADAMGLGKTVQALGLMMQNRPPIPGTQSALARKAGPNIISRPGTTLIVCPVALIHQWAREISTKAPHYFNNIRVHHGATRIKSLKEMKGMDVIITSYGTLAREYPIKKHKKILNAQEKMEDEERIERDKGPLFRLKFFRIILDEAHTIKNPAANVSVACCNIDATRQWCLTGTPLQNKVDDIFPILSILRVPYFSDRATFRKEISKSSEGAKKLRGVIGPFLIRRKKDDKIAGEKVLTLPEKTIEMKILQLDESEGALYKQVESQMVSEINKYLLAGTAVKKINHMFVMILRLRQLCIHPLLILDHLAAKNGINQADLFAPGGGQITFEDLKDRGLFDLQDSAICGICSSEAFNPVVSSTCRHCFCRTCIDDTIENEESDCPVCSRPIGRLTKYDPNIHQLAPLAIQDLSEPAVVVAKQEDLGEQVEKTSSSSSSTYLGSRTPTKLEDSVRDIEASLSSPPPRSRPELISLMDSSDDEELPTLSLRDTIDSSRVIKSENADPVILEVHPLATSPSSELASVKCEEKGDLPLRNTPGTDMVKAESSPVRTASIQSDMKPQLDIKSLLGSHREPTSDTEASRPKPRYTVDPADMKEDILPPQTKEERQAEVNSWQELLKLEFLPSTKLTAVETQLREWMTLDDSKIIVFSQFVKALDLLDKVCQSNEYEVLRYQGSMNMKEREATIARFEDPAGPRILLMSLKAGGVGLNLVCASKVILLDFWWNHACESQAIDRCHRMGQVREVMVIRTYLPGTVEEKILALQEDKLKTAGMVLGETEGGEKMAKLGLRELLSLFGRVTKNADGVQQIEAAQ